MFPTSTGGAPSALTEIMISFGLCGRGAQPVAAASSFPQQDHRLWCHGGGIRTTAKNPGYNTELKTEAKTFLFQVKGVLFVRSALFSSLQPLGVIYTHPRENVPLEINTMLNCRCNAGCDTL